MGSGPPSADHCRRRARALSAIATLAALSALFATGLGTGVAAAAWNQPQASPLVVDATRHPQPPHAATVAGTPYLAWVEEDRAYLPTVGIVRVVRLQGGAWTPVGGPLNIDQTHVAAFVAIASVGGVPYVAWTEKNGSGIYQLYVSSFNGSSWVQVGPGPLNVSPSVAVGQVGITDVGGVPYVAFTEGGTVYVDSYNSGTNTWSEAGGGQVAPGDVPSVATVAGSLYVAFLGGSYPYNVYVYTLGAGNTWVPVGSSLNFAANRNSENPAIGDVGGVPEVAFAEEDTAGQNDYELHVDAFSGGTWTPQGGALTLQAGDVSLDPAIVGIGGVPFVAFDEHPNGTGGGPGAVVSHFVRGAWAQVGAPLVGDSTDMATPINPTITAVGPVPYAAWLEDKVRAARLEPDLLAETATPTATGATLRVQVNDDGVPLPVGFEYGGTSAFGTSTPLQTTAGTGMTTISQPIGGLTPQTLYDWRAFGSDTFRATSLGSLATFSTLALGGVGDITDLKISPSAFVPANAGGSVVVARAAKRGAIVSYLDSQAATTTLTVQRPAAGRRAGHSCVKPTKGNVKHKPCTRWVTVGSFQHLDVAGTNRFRFTGRLSHHVLRPGHYRLQAIAHDTAGAGPPTFRRFRVKG